MSQFSRPHTRPLSLSLSPSLPQLKRGRGGDDFGNDSSGFGDGGGRSFGGGQGGGGRNFGGPPALEEAEEW